MKKFIFFLILIILIAGVVLYFGWIRIPENSYGVFFSSITGYDKNVLETGKFHFKWQKLIPKTSKIYIINNSPRKKDININGTLPSGNIYSQVMPGNPNFSYSISLAITYSLSKDFIIESLNKKGNNVIPDQSGIDNFFIETDRQIESILKNHIENGFLASAESNQSNTDIEKNIFFPDLLKSIITSNIFGIEINELVVIDRSFPDINLYRTAEKQYREISNDRKKFLLESELKSAGIEADLEKRLETLEKYGELLTKYPILLEYLKINPDRDILKESNKVKEPQR